MAQPKVPWVLALVVAVANFVLGLGGCAERPATPVVRTWLMGAAEPAFDPDGPPNAKRWALERMLSRGLVDRDSAGTIVGAGAARWVISPDSLTYAFGLRPGLAFSDGTPCLSSHFLEAIRSGLARRDHGTFRWLLRHMRGMDRVRAGRGLPALGLEAPDDSTVIVRLVRPDSLLLEALAVPGVSTVWKDRDTKRWQDAIGLGPFEVTRAQPGRQMSLARATGVVTDADTVLVRFGLNARRVRSLLRSGLGDLVWPIAPGLLDEALPDGYRRREHWPSPSRKLLLVIRADLAPTTRLAARHALAHGLNRSALMRALGPRGGEVQSLLEGAGPFEFPRYDADEVRYWLRRGSLGRSFHVVMTYDADGVAAEVARTLQGDWSRFSIYVELLPLRGKRLERELLQGRSHLLLVDAQSVVQEPATDLARMVRPRRGPAIGTFTTGWRTREFDRWLAGRVHPDQWLARAQRRLALEKVVVPLAELPWIWVERDVDAGATLHPRFGPRPLVKLPG